MTPPRLQGRETDPPRDYRIIGCALCRNDIGFPFPIKLPPPWGSLDSRDDVRVHTECYRQLVWAVWSMLGFAPIPQHFQV